MKIKIESLPDFEFTEDEINFIKLLEVDEFFEDFVVAVRKKLGISPDKSKSVDIEEVNSYSAILVGGYKSLPDYWITTFSQIIMRGVAVPPFMKNITDTDFNLEGVSDEKVSKGYTQKVVIEVRTKTSLRQLKMFIDDHKQEIEEALSQLPQKPQLGVENIDIHLEIMKLRKQGKEFREIADELYPKYGKNFSDEVSINTRYNRFKDRIAKTLRKDPKGLDKAKKLLESIR